MAAPSSSKQTKRARPPKLSVGSRERGGLLLAPLVVDPENWTVLDAQELGHAAAYDLSHRPAELAKLSERIKGSADRDKDQVIVVYSLDQEKQSGVSVNQVRPPRPGPADEALFRSVLEKTLESAKEVQRQHQDKKPLSTRQFLRHVARTLADKAEVVSQEGSAEEEGWRDLLERGLRTKISLLKSRDFKSVSEASELLGIGEHAVRKRIDGQKLFALRMPGDGDYRIPLWALDPRLGGATLAELLSHAKDTDAWRVYHFMSTPHGSLNGLRPFECLMSDENLPPTRSGARNELRSYLRLPERASLLEPVKQAFEAELEESPQA